MNFDFSVAESETSINALAPEWDALAALSPAATPFQTAAVTLGLWRVFSPRRRPLIATARDAGGRLKALLALGYQWRRIGPAPARALVPLAGWHGSFFDAVVDPADHPAALTYLMQQLQLRRGWEFMECRGLPPTAALSQVTSGTQGTFTNDAIGHSVHLSPGEAFMSAGRRRELRRLVRQLSDNHVAALVEIGNDPNRRREVLIRFAEMHVQRWTRTPTPSPLSDLGVRERFVSWLTSSDAIDSRLITLQVDDRIRGVLIVLRGNQRDVAWRVAYDTDLAHFSPGIQLLTKGMEVARDAGQVAFDLGRGDESYKSTWHTVHLDLLSARWTGAGVGIKALNYLGGLYRRKWPALRQRYPGAQT